MKFIKYMTCGIICIAFPPFLILWLILEVIAYCNRKPTQK